MNGLIQVHNLEDAEFIMFSSLLGKKNDNKDLALTINKMYKIMMNEEEEFYLINDQSRQMYEFLLFGKGVYFKTLNFARDIKEVEDRKWYLKTEKRFNELKPHIDKLDIGIPALIIEEAYRIRPIELTFLDVQYAQLSIEHDKDTCNQFVKPLIQKRLEEIRQERMQLIF